MTTLSWEFQVPELLAAYKRAADKRPWVAGKRARRATREER